MIRVDADHVLLDGQRLVNLRAWRTITGSSHVVTASEERAATLKHGAVLPPTMRAGNRVVLLEARRSDGTRLGMSHVISAEAERDAYAPALGVVLDRMTAKLDQAGAT